VPTRAAKPFVTIKSVFNTSVASKRDFKNVTNFIVSNEPHYSRYEVSYDGKSDLWIRMHLDTRDRCKAVFYTGVTKNN